MSEQNAVVQRAMLLHQSGRNTEALRILGPHLAQNPGDLEAQRITGWAQHGLGDYVSAVYTSARLVAAAPHAVGAFLLHASVLAKLKRYDEAAAAAQRAIELTPNSPTPYLVTANLMLGSGQVGDQTEELARRAVALDPADASAHRVLGSVLLARKRWKEAKIHLTQAAALDPTDMATTNELARVELRRGRTGLAALGFAAAARAGGTDPIPARNLQLAVGVAIRRSNATLTIAALFLARSGLQVQSQANYAIPNVGQRLGAVLALLAVAITWLLVCRGRAQVFKVIARSVMRAPALRWAVALHLLGVLSLVLLCFVDSTGVWSLGILAMLGCWGMLYLERRTVRAADQRRR